MLSVTVRFPLGVYHAQVATDFAKAEWPPHPVRLIAALKAAAHGRPASDLRGALRAIEALATAGAPLIVAPRVARTLEHADGDDQVARLRGASRWAPRNHELSELGGGISPRDLGRGRAEIQKVGVAIGDIPIAFEWPDLILDDDVLAVLTELVEDLTVLGTARSPALVSLGAATPASKPRSVWAPAVSDARYGDDVLAQVRVANERTTAELDVWHSRRSAPLRRNGSVGLAPYNPPVMVGDTIPYIHGIDAAQVPVDSWDPEWWGDMLIVEVNRSPDPARDIDLPKAPATFALARATRKALLDTYAAEGTSGEAPAVLRGRAGQPHAAFVPLSFVAEPCIEGGRARANGSTLGVAVILPHPARLRDVAAQRREIEVGLSRLLGLTGGQPVEVRVPGVGPVRLKMPDGPRVPEGLREARYRQTASQWSTVTPLVHSRYLPRRSEDALFEQVALECNDVGLPQPARIAVRRGPRFRGSPGKIDGRQLPASWTGPLRGPQAHLDLWFDEPVRGPILLGRARHFGLGLCLPFTGGEE